MFKNARKLPLSILFSSVLVLTVFSCSKEDTPTTETELENAMEETEDVDAETSTENDETTTEASNPSDDSTSDEDENNGENVDSVNCTNPADFIFNETDGLVLVEFENTDFSGNWKLRSNGNSYTGDGYLVWEGSQFFNEPGNGMLIYRIKIENPGTYKFVWNSSIKLGNDGTEHNDSWLRFNDADDFFGLKNGGNSKIYPAGTGKSPNPKGASKDGWFKLFRSGNDLDFKWQSRTSDHDAHDVYVKFNSPGIYTMEVSARSSGHAIDKFALVKESTSDDVINSNAFSSINCN